MSYSDAHQGRSAKPIIAVGLLHAVIAYGFISGLAYTVIQREDTPIVARNIPDDVPPPPKVEPRLDQRASTKRTTLAAPDATIERPTLGGPDMVTVPLLGTGEAIKADLPPTQTIPPTHASQARGAAIAGDRAAWVTADDYPPAALRQGVEGSVGISLTIGTDGRVAGCEVTATSGNAVLDQATCHVYARRARFAPALDDEGRPVVAHRADRVRWQLPAQ